MEHLGGIQEALREQSEKYIRKHIQGVFSKQSVNNQGNFSEHAWEHSENIE
jgi:hypothetical protein